MKAILEFDLPEDQQDHLLATHALKLYCVIEEMGEWLRAKDRYGDEKTFTIEALRKVYWQYIEASGVGDLFR